MNVFAFTRIKLTVFYVTAIMVVSTMFSYAIYKGVSQNIEQSFTRAENRLRTAPGFAQQLLRQASNEAENRQELHQFFLEELQESKKKVLLHLLMTNAFILLASSVASYALAGRTLKPIEDVLSDQKRFIADASHELRTPLTSLKTAIEVSLRDKKIDQRAKKVLESNLEDVDALKELIDSLLQLASQENKTIIKQLIDVHEVMGKVLKIVKPLADEKELKITSKLQHQQVLASETGLQQLFTILLDNAIKYSNCKGKINVLIIPGKRTVTIKIADTGIGINKKYLQHIFDRFYRIDSSRTCSQKPGFGLGLSVAKQIVANHNGTITVESEIGKGTTFTTTLPL
ncbi:MAG: two-component sensor histidine kinase [Patescibacteria group bacterium]|nr:MAG: two-component sensor histidine kinase [Patescibacteria group bacterium]